MSLMSLYSCSVLMWCSSSSSLYPLRKVTTFSYRCSDCEDIYILCVGCWGSWWPGVRTETTRSIIGGVNTVHSPGRVLGSRLLNPLPWSWASNTDLQADKDTQLYSLGLQLGYLWVQLLSSPLQLCHLHRGANFSALTYLKLGGGKQTPMWARLQMKCVSVCDRIYLQGIWSGSELSWTLKMEFWGDGEVLHSETNHTNPHKSYIMNYIDITDGIWFLY